MSIGPELTPAIQAFLIRDYVRCSNLAGPLLEKNVTLEALYLVLASYMRAGHADEVEKVGLPYIGDLTEKWDQRMAGLTMGLAKMEDITAEAQSDKQRLQFFFYYGSYLASQHKYKEARETFDKYMISGISPVSCMELYLLGIEHNYLASGALGTDLDKPVIELNNQASQLFQQGKHNEALKVAEQAHETAKKSLGQFHPAFINTLNNLGLIQLTIGKGIAAKPVLEEHTRLMRIVAGPNDPAYATSLENLAMGIIKGRQMGEMFDLDRAESLAREALAVRQRAGGADLAQPQAIIDAIAQVRGEAAKPKPAPAPPPEKKPGGWARWFGRKTPQAEVRETYGVSAEDPILCHDPSGEMQFLLSLRCPSGHRMRGRRSGSGQGKCSHPDSHQSPFGGDPGESCIVDRYETVCDGGEYSCVLFFDMYHPDPPPQTAPRGMSRVEG